MNTTHASTLADLERNDAYNTISAQALAQRLQTHNEIAVVDVRELVRHVDDGHLLLSVPLPLSVLEIRAGTLIPRRNTPVIVYDAGDGVLAGRAARRLIEAGYRDVLILDGGVTAWRAAGLEVYTGLHVLSKAFGEFVEHAYETPRIPPSELKSLLDNGEDVIVLDGRSLDEFSNFSIPGALACPNAELPYRVHDLVPSKDTLVVVSCAGRTRSIIGAQALINTGLPNRVASLENGALAWLKAGYQLNNQEENTAPDPSPEGREKARQSTAKLRQRFSIENLDKKKLEALGREDDRTLYVLDVRTRAEFEAGHLQGALWAEGGQLVQATDQWVGTRHARIVLVDNADGVRSAITASWLIQLGWSEVFTYAFDPRSDTVEEGSPHRQALVTPATAERISAQALKQGIDSDNIVIFDFSSSATYRAGHIAGARFALRSRIDERLVQASVGKSIVVIAADPNIANLAAGDIAQLTNTPVRVFADGVQAWRDLGLAVGNGTDAQWHDQPDDIWLSPYFREDRFAAFDTYIDWEIGLIDQINRDPTVSFQTFGTAD